MAESQWRAALRREWQRITPPPFDAEREGGATDEPLDQLLGELRRAYRAATPSSRLRARAGRAAAETRRTALALLAAAAAIAIATFVGRSTARQAPPAPSPPASQARVVRTDALRTEILCGKVRFVFVNEPPPTPASEVTESER